MRAIWIIVALMSVPPAFAQTTAPSQAGKQKSRPLEMKPAPAPQLSVPEGVDVETLVALTMATAARDAEGDLRTLLGSIQDANRQKKETRRSSKLKAAGENPCNTHRVDDWKLCIQNVERKIATVPASERAALDVEISRLQSDLDSMSELGEMESLRMQMVMDRTSKAMSMLSNIQKKQSDTAQSITQNIK